MLNAIQEMFAAAARQTAKENRRLRHRVGPGRETWRTHHRHVRRGKYGGVGFCSGTQECARRLQRRYA